jgi:hypothetical protein
LHAPCHKVPSWNGKREFLTKDLGLGTLIIFVGQQMDGTTGDCSETNTAAA